eukprot:scaffold136456_cov68-Attheya_sp.AAC.2
MSLDHYRISKREASLCTKAYLAYTSKNNIESKVNILNRASFSRKLQGKSAWERLYNGLKKFAEEHDGYTHISNKEGNLQRWVTNQSQALRLQGEKQTPFEVAALTKRKIALESIGFDWRTRNKKVGHQA